MKTVTIECKNIKKSFKSGSHIIEILHTINLTAYSNEMIMLMGPSGSGKTTLISIIGGILSADSGECFVLGKQINELPEKERTAFRGHSIGFLFQHFTLVPTLNALENAAIPLLCQSVDRTTAFNRAKKVLQAMGLEHDMHKNPEQLSGGQQQRVAIARACIHEPAIILCDEPTSFLDFDRGQKIMTLLKELQIKNQCTIIVVTHDARILNFADRIINIEDGTIKETTLRTENGVIKETALK